jgi:NOL1/NOP2/fmu family ribosome biogenesis protein
MKYDILYGKELKKLFTQLTENFGCSAKDIKEQFRGYVFLLDKNKVYCSSNAQDLDMDEIHKLPVFQIGIYFGKWIPNGVLLSPEGAELIHPIAQDHIEEVTSEEMKQYLHGEPIPRPQIDTGSRIVLLVNHSGTGVVSALGSAKVYNGEIHNYFPKERRIRSL